MQKRWRSPCKQEKEDLADTVLHNESSFYAKTETSQPSLFNEVEEEDEEMDDECSSEQRHVVATQRHLASMAQTTCVLHVYLYRDGYGLALHRPHASHRRLTQPPVTYVRASTRPGCDPLMECMRHAELPVHVLDQLDAAATRWRVFTNGRLLCAVHARLQLSVTEAESCQDGRHPPPHYVILQSSQRSLLYDLARICEQNCVTSVVTRLEIEARLTALCSPRLHLEPHPVSEWRLFQANGLAASLNVKRPTKRRLETRCVDDNTAFATDSPHPPVHHMYTFLCALRRRRSHSQSASVGVPPPEGSSPSKRVCVSPVGHAVSHVFDTIGTISPLINRLALKAALPTSHSPFPSSSTDHTLHVLEQTTIECCTGRVPQRVTVTTLRRASDGSYHGRLCVHREGALSQCEFPLCCERLARLYMGQCVDICSEYGRRKTCVHRVCRPSMHAVSSRVAVCPNLAPASLSAQLCSEAAGTAKPRALLGASGTVCQPLIARSSDSIRIIRPAQLSPYSTPPSALVHHYNQSNNSFAHRNQSADSIQQINQSSSCEYPNSQSNSNVQKYSQSTNNAYCYNQSSGDILSTREHHVISSSVCNIKSEPDAADHVTSLHRLLTGTGLSTSAGRTIAVKQESMGRIAELQNPTLTQLLNTPSTCICSSSQSLYHEIDRSDNCHTPRDTGCHLGGAEILSAGHSSPRALISTRMCVSHMSSSQQLPATSVYSRMTATALSHTRCPHTHSGTPRPDCAGAASHSSHSAYQHLNMPTSTSRCSEYQHLNMPTSHSAYQHLNMPTSTSRYSEYQHINTLTPTSTSRPGYQYLNMPTPTSTSRSGYQHLNMPTPTSTSRPGYQHLNMPTSTSTSRPGY